MKAIIVEDQPEVRDEIRALLARYCLWIEVTGMAGNVSQAVTLVQDTQPDLILLDIELPDGSGFDILDRITVPVKVIFITGSDAYAIRAFRYAAVDYLLKPVDPEELVEAVNRVKGSVELDAERLQMSRSLFYRKQDIPERLALHTADKIHFVEIRDIIRCMADGNYTKFFLTGTRSLLVARTLKDYDELLSAAGFIRVHQSHLVNMRAAREYVKSDGGYLIMSDGAKVPVSTRKKAEVMDRFNQLPHV